MDVSPISWGGLLTLSHGDDADDAGGVEGATVVAPTASPPPIFYGGEVNFCLCFRISCDGNRFIR
jgi:hypothetical protein